MSGLYAAIFAGVAAPHDEFEVFEWVLFAELTRVSIPEGTFLVTDASTLERPKNQVCGFCGRDVWHRFAGARLHRWVSTGKQTVSGGELFALWQVYERAQGQAEVVSDSTYALHPFEDEVCEVSRARSSHFDFWGRVVE